MTKRIIALLLALILTVGLLPTVALAEDAPKEDGQTAASGVSTVQSGTDSDNNTDNPVHVIKTFTPGENGKFGSLTLEAYVTNPLQVVTETVPLDIVLVLDQSGSMGYCINCDTEFKEDEWDEDTCNNTAATFEYKAISRNNARHDTTYYIVSDGQYYEVKWCNGYHPGLFNDHYSGWYYNGRYGHTRVDSTTTLYERVVMTGHKHRLDALTEALNTFVNSVVANRGDHNVAVVGYAGTSYSSDDKSSAHNSELLTGTNLNKGSEYSENESRYYPQKDLTKDPINGKAYTDLNTSPQEYSNALQRMKTDEGVANVRAAINALTANGATRTYAGMDMAKNILAKAKTANSNRQQVVILFTDGDTNSEQDDVYDLANDMKKDGVLVYTVGLFKDADQTKGEHDRKKGRDDNNLFLNKVSNNSIEYMNQGSKPRTKTDKTYYLPAQNAASLSAVFEQISKEVSKLDLKVDSKAILQDTLSGYFTFDADTNAAGSITVQTAAFEGIDEDGQMKWGTPKTATGTNVEVKGKKITVTGFDYGSPENLVTVHENSKPKYTGKKLIVTIPIKPDTTSNVTWKAGSNLYDTNVTTDNDKAGLGNYGYKDKQGTLSTTLPTSPKAPVTGYKVIYDVKGGDSTCPTVAAEDNNKVYIEGQKYNVLESLTDTTGKWSFTGWKANENYSGDDVSGEKIMGTANVTYYGKFEKNEVEVDLSKFVQKKLELTGVTELPTEERFTVTLTEGSTTLTATTDAIKSTPDASNLPTFKNGLQSVTLSVGQHTFKVKETAGSTSGMNYDSTEYTLTVTVNADGTATADKVTITNTYKPADSDGFTLNGKFQKTLVSNVELSKLPDAAKSFELKIWEGTDTTATAKATGTATINSLTKDEQTGKYTGSANFNFGNTVLTFTEAKEYTYTVQETAGTVAGMQYDTNTYTLTITVVNNNGKFEVQSATIGSTDMKNRGPLTITNTFTAAELPLDPPDGPGVPEKPTLGAKVIKSLTGDTKTETFQAQLLEGTTVKATASAVATTDAPAAFKGFGTLVFTEAKTYNYTIKEIPGSTAGMKYDESFPNGHTMDITVAENAEKKLFVSEVKIDNVAVDLASNAAWLTITNTYTEPTYAVEKSVINEDASDNIPDSLDRDIYQYPTDNKYIVEKTYTDDTITFLYVIKVSGNQGAVVKVQETDDGEFVIKNSTDSRANIVWDETEQSYTVTLNQAVDASDPIKLYAKKTFTKVEGKFPTTATNALLVNGEDGPKDDTTIIERGNAVIDFSKMVQKHLTATGNGTVSEVTFYVDVDGRRDDAIAYALPEVTIPDTYRLVLMATFNSVTGNGYDETKPFEGAIAVNQAGVYIFKLTERTDAAQTSITYDETEYLLYVNVAPKSDGSLEVTDWDIVGSNNTELRAPEKITFHNTIDTGRDDYIPIIIPTIINKDTGMLNKTDHFAYVIGYPDGTVHPNGQITRAEVATIFFRLLRDEVRDGAFTTSNTYSDVAYGKWYNNPISTMSALGIITGYPDGTFKPNKPITRAEFAAIAARFDETQSGKSATFSDVIGHWAAKEIGIAYYNDWIKGYPDGTFKPDQNITRAEAMTLINRVLERKPESPADLLTNMNKWTDNMDTSKWYYLDVQEATNSHGYTRKTFNYELWRQMLPDPDWSRYER